MTQDNRVYIKKYLQITNIEQVINAMSEADKRIIEAEQMLDELKGQITSENVFNDIQDLLYSIAITFYAKGIKTGSKLEKVKEI